MRPTMPKENIEQWRSEREFQDRRSAALREALIRKGQDEWEYPLVREPSNPPPNFDSLGQHP